MTASLNNPQVVSHYVFGALTRPAVYAGVTLNFFAVNALCNLIVFIATLHMSWVIITFSMIHLIGYIACSYDYQFVSIAMTKLRCANCRNQAYWGAVSYGP
ncbi:MAG: hypothetical protein Tsb005_19250 [Gammaproteobacteria bacterium]